MTASRVLHALVAPLYYAAAVGLAVTIVSSANASSRAYEAAAAHETVEGKTDRMIKDVLQAMSLGLYHGGDDAERVVASDLELAERHGRKAAIGAWVLLALSVGFIFYVSAVKPAPGVDRRLRSTRHLLGVSAVCLFVGLLAPILTVVAQKEVAVLGTVVLQYESKGIVATVQKLFAVGNEFVAVMLLLFSILLPVAKILLSYAALIVPHARARRLSVAIIRVIGRWSMTDVFVVAVLLAFLAADTSQLTDASVGPGLYFFAGYGLVSILTGQLMLRLVEG